MSKFIILHEKYPENDIIINVDNIMAIEPLGSGALVFVRDKRYAVVDSQVEIFTKIYNDINVAIFLTSPNQLERKIGKAIQSNINSVQLSRPSQQEIESFDPNDEI
jgi:hypothetical protein